MASSAIALTGSTAGFVTEQLRIQQAQRNAGSAEAVARACGARSPVRSARRTTRRKARSESALDQAQSDAGEARQQVTRWRRCKRCSRFETLRTQIAEGLQSLDAPAPTVNAEGRRPKRVGKRDRLSG